MFGVSRVTFHVRLVLDRGVIDQNLGRIHNQDGSVPGGIEGLDYPQPVAQFPRLAITLNQSDPAAIVFKVDFDLELRVSAQECLTAIQEDSFHAS
jgi:hypothetical protein